MEGTEHQNPENEANQMQLRESSGVVKATHFSSLDLSDMLIQLQKGSVKEVHARLLKARQESISTMHHPSISKQVAFGSIH